MKKETKDFLTSWKMIFAFVLAMSSVTGAALGGVEKAYLHFTGLGTLRAEMIAMNDVQTKERRLDRIRYDIRDLNSKIYDLERRQEGIWARQPMTPSDNRVLRRIERDLRQFKNDRRDLRAIERELRK